MASQLHLLMHVIMHLITEGRCRPTVSHSKLRRLAEFHKHAPPSSQLLRSTPATAPGLHGSGAPSGASSARFARFPQIKCVIECR
jgi:hypothetical protein